MVGNRSVSIDFDVPARMRDGVVLRANVYRPRGNGRWPTLLTRLPYDKNHPMVSEWLDPVQTAAEGFLVVVQDTRGRFASAGEWTPYRFEKDDGHDAVEWAAGLPGSNGRVGMFGLSYFGFTQWAAAMAQPTALGAIAPAKTWAEPTDGLFSRGGALELGLALPWLLELAGDAVARLAVSEDERNELLAAIAQDYEGLLTHGFWDLPVDKSALLLRPYGAEPGGMRLEQHPHSVDWPRIAGGHAKVRVPSLDIAGWYDVFLQGSLDNYMAMAALGRPSRLVVGPWTHTANRDPIGELRFGLASAQAGFPAHASGDVGDVQRAWFRRHLEPGGHADDPDEAPVRIFVMGRNEWRDEQSWPLTRARMQRWFLGPAGSLKRLPPEHPAEPIKFVYDPNDPTPTIGGASEMGGLVASGPCDQSPIEARPDVRVFTSAPLDRDLEVTGRVRLVLCASSGAPSTDWVGRLCDVYPDGRSIVICDGILRVFRHADQQSCHEVDLWSTSNVFLAGHRLRVQVASSSFPRWDRNLNTGKQRQPCVRIARQRIDVGPGRLSFIELPVVA